MLLKLLRKVFLVKEIVSKKGVVHFQRYRILQFWLFSIYVHYIAKSDEDKCPHSHPWNFVSFILSGGYFEYFWENSLFRTLINDSNTPHIKTQKNTYLRFSFICRKYDDFHKIELLAPTWTLVFTGRRVNDNWGYLTETGFKNHIEYRKEKNAEQI